MAFAPQRPQSIYGRTQVPESSRAIRWDVGAQVGKNLGSSFAALGAMAGQRQRESAIRAQQAKEREAALAIQGGQLAIQSAKVGMAQELHDLEVKEYAANAKMARKVQQAQIDAAEARGGASTAQELAIGEEEDRKEAFNVEIDERFKRGEEASDAYDLFAFLGKGDLEQWERQYPQDASDRRFALSDWGRTFGKAEVDTTRDDYEAFLETQRRAEPPSEFTASTGEKFAIGKSGTLTRLGDATSQRTGVQVESDLKKQAIRAGDYSEAITDLDDAFGYDKDMTRFFLKDEGALREQTKYRTATWTRTRLTAGQQTKFQEAFADRAKGVELTAVDEADFDKLATTHPHLGGTAGAPLNSREKLEAKKIRKRQAVETLQQIGNEMFPYEDEEGGDNPTTPRERDPDQNDVYPEGYKPRAQWFKMMGVRDPYEWVPDPTHAKNGEWKLPVITPRGPPLIYGLSVPGTPRPQNPSEFYETTHPNHASGIAKAFPPKE